MGTGRTERLLGDAERDVELAALRSRSGTQRWGRSSLCHIPDEPGLSFSLRCCLLRACCFAKLAARGCRVGPVQALSAPRAGIPSCSECSAPHALSRPSLSPSAAARGARGRAQGAVGPRRVGDAVPERRLQVRAGGAAVPGSAPQPRPLPGPSRALLKQKFPLQNRLGADPPRDGAGSAPQPWRVSSSELFGLETRTTTLR